LIFEKIVPFMKSDGLDSFLLVGLLIGSLFIPSVLSHDAGLYWSNMSVIHASGVPILHPFSGFLENGQICAVIGPSGSGKSSLLNAIGGCSDLPVKGDVWIHNENGFAFDLMRQKNQVAYLRQHDSFFQTLTVRETLDLAAYLEFPSVPKALREEWINRTLDSLGIAKISSRQIGDSSRNGGAGISGGERRRLSVGIELLTKPSVFLADEPTTGLDSSQAAKIVQLIRNLSSERRIPAMLSLHQPRATIWKMFDSFILIAPGGRICYAGPRQSASNYFSELGYDCPNETNYAEFYIDLVSLDTEDAEQAKKDEERVNHLFHAFNSRQHNRNETLKYQRIDHIMNLNRNENGIKSSFFRRFGALILRSWRQNIRNTRYNIARLVACLGCSSLFSQIFQSVRCDVAYARSIADRTALLSFGVINMCMMTLMKTVHLFGKEQPVVLRERMRDQYSSLEYLLSKVLAEIPLDILFTGIFTSVLKALTGLRISWINITKLFSVMTVTGASLGFAIGSFSKDGETALAVALPILVLFMVVGVINPSGIDKDSPPPTIVRFLKSISPIKWAIEGLLIAEFKGIDLRTKGQNPWERIRDLPKFGAFTMVKNGDQILQSLGLEGATYDRAVRRMIILSFSNLFLSWIGLEESRKRQNKLRPYRKLNHSKKCANNDPSPNSIKVISLIK
jgi:ABC-type multidrug transport system ATPase subunit